MDQQLALLQDQDLPKHTAPGEDVLAHLGASLAPLVLPVVSPNPRNASATALWKRLVVAYSHLGNDDEMAAAGWDLKQELFFHLCDTAYFDDPYKTMNKGFKKSVKT